jgi:hypothetical protein
MPDKAVLSDMLTPETRKLIVEALDNGDVQLAHKIFFGVLDIVMRFGVVDTICVVDSLDLNERQRALFCSKGCHVCTMGTP